MKTKIPSKTRLDFDKKGFITFPKFTTLLVVTGSNNLPCYKAWLDPSTRKSIIRPRDDFREHTFPSECFVMTVHKVTILQLNAEGLT